MSFSLPETGKKIFRGDTIVIEFAVSQDGVALNLTGYSIWFTAKKQKSDNDTAPTAIQKTLSSGIVVLDAAAGHIKVTILPADTATLSADTTYVCDLQVKSGGGVITTVADGTMAITLDVTQAVT
jgi:hypothetical protein